MATHKTHDHTNYLSERGENFIRISLLCSQLRHTFRNFICSALVTVDDLVQYAATFTRLLSQQCKVFLVHVKNKLVTVLAEVPKTRPGICISDTLQRALMRWQRVLGIRRSAEANKHSVVKPASIPSPFVVKRTAWM
ncbi:unnamed protein product [Gongylonema pulchrum]|uniref:Uncharacterized protein n=1 Tax=Gongylonema pulchrum TaxID=637853 RepID=A0A183EMF5_9BILA|nr:unnamed protein product [Gongylonema pulchrum]